MNTKLLQQFLIVAKKNGYASDTPPTKEKDGSFSNRYEKEDWSFHDNWFGGEPFGGREVVFFQNKPYWMMAYYGSDTQKAPDTISALRKALSQMPDNMPLRGPLEFADGEYHYSNIWEGTLGRFQGQDKIVYRGEVVYEASYSGGFVDQKSE